MESEQNAKKDSFQLNKHTKRRYFLLSIKEKTPLRKGRKRKYCLDYHRADSNFSDFVTVAIFECLVTT